MYTLMEEKPLSLLLFGDKLCVTSVDNDDK